MFRQTNPATSMFLYAWLPNVQEMTFGAYLVLVLK